MNLWSYQNRIDKNWKLQLTKTFDIKKKKKKKPVKLPKSIWHKKGIFKNDKKHLILTKLLRPIGRKKNTLIDKNILY